MATPHADFQAKRCSGAPGNPLSRVLGGALPLTLPADACTASKGLLMGLNGERARGWCRIVAAGGRACGYGRIRTGRYTLLNGINHMYVEQT